MRLAGKKLSRVSVGIFSGLLVVAGLATLFSIPGRVYLADMRHKFSRLNYPYREIAQRLRQEGFTEGLILAQNYVIGADLKLNFRDSFVMTPEEKMNFPAPIGYDCLLVVWDRDTRARLTILPLC